MSSIVESGAISPIKARERTAVPLTAADYRFLETSAEFWQLIEMRIVSLERTARHAFAIRGAAFVGHALVDGRSLVVEEKIPGALVELLRLADAVEARIPELPSFIDRLGAFLDDLAHRFLRELGAYLLRGRHKKYVSVGQVGGLPKGKISGVRTMRLWAAGRCDQVAFTSDYLSPNLIENRLIGLALHGLDRLLAASESRSLMLARTRSMAHLFDDVDWPSMVRLPPIRIASFFEGVLSDARLADTRSLLSLARVFALRFGVGMAPESTPIPIAWFVNLEDLFEDAVRAALRQIAALEMPSWMVSDWKGDPKYVFEESKRAKPDIVVHEGALARVVLDAKYKDPDSDVDEGDLYQLLVHMRTYAASVGVLVYPSDRFSFEPFGQSGRFGFVYVATLNVADLRKDAGLLLNALKGKTVLSLESAGVH